jgi:hydroxymethylglutaryl-CoA reductase (NADPH)
MADFPIVPGRGLVTKVSTRMRQDFLESINIGTDRLSQSQLDLHEIQNNIESYIGTAEIPLGIVGPLLFVDGTRVEQVYCAAGTLEGALIASMNRGAKALSQSGGFTAEVAWQRMTRVPMFLFNNFEEAIVFADFVPTILGQVKTAAEKYSNHAILQEIKPIHDGAVVHLRFAYSTGDASGQNMTTVCTWHAMLFIAEKFTTETGITPLDFVIEGNGASDKKISQYNIHSGRGVNVVASCMLEEKVINDVLRTTSEKIERCFSPSRLLAARDGMVGYNINVANAIAAIYVATGQDLACIHESGVGTLHIQRTSAGLSLRLNLPNLVIGTVGGGTHLPKQSQALEIMKCLGSGKVERLAKLIAGFALGLEISTYAAIVSGEFAKAHERLGRNKPVKWLLRSELTHDFILARLNGYFHDKTVTHIAAANEVLLENGILTNIAGKITRKLIGFVPLTLKYHQEQNSTVELNLLLKSKATDEEVIKGLHLMAASIDPQLSDLFKESKNHLEYCNCHVKELELYSHLHETGFKFMPYFYGKFIDPRREIYFLINELLDYGSLKIVNSENNPEKWSDQDILNVIKTATTFHSSLDPTKLPSVLPFEPWKSKDLYKKLVTILINERAEQDAVEQLRDLLASIDSFEERALSISATRTVIHNDFNPRNIAIRSNGDPIIYDWELAVIDLPHRDIVEFLSFVLPEDVSKETLWRYLEYHHSLCGTTFWKDWLGAYRYALQVYIATRVSLYEVSGILVKYDFSRRILKTSLRMLELIGKG